MGDKPDNLSSKAARGAFLTFSGQIARALIQMAGVIILARLLVPADFGLVAMVVAIAGVGEIIREFGLGLAAIQAEVLTVAQRNNLFWASTILGCAVALVFFSAAQPIASLYGDPRLVAVTQCIAVTFIFNGMATQYRAGLQRDLRFAGVAAADVGSMLFGVAAAVALATLDFGYWSIVVQQISQPVVGLLIVVIASRWIPGRMRRGQGTRPLLSVGWNVFVYQLFMYASRNIDTVLVGAKFGAVAVGYYSRAFSLMTAPLAQFLTPSTRVVVSVLSRLQDDLTEFARYLQRAQDAMTLVCLSVLALLFGAAPAVVELLLGTNWADVTPIFRILAVAGMFQVFAHPPVWALLALGYSRANLIQTIVARCALIAAVVVGSFHSMQGVAVGYACGMAIVWPISLVCIAKVSNLHVGGMLRNSFRHMTVFSASAGVVSLCLSIASLSTLPAYVQISIGAAIMGAFLGVLTLTWPSFRRDVMNLYRIFARLRSGKGLSL